MTPDSVDYQLLFETLPGNYLAFTPDFVVVAVSAGMERAIPRAKTQLIGQALPDNAVVYASLRHVQQHGTAHEQTLLANPLATGQATATPQRWRSRAWPVHTAEGHVRYILYSLDELPAPALQPAPNPEQEQWQRVADALPLHVWTSNKDGAADYINEQMATYAGVTTETLPPDSWLTLVHPDEQGATTARVLQAMDAGTPYEVGVRLRRADGTYRLFLVKAQPQYNAANQVVGWVGTQTDIDEQRQRHQHLQQIINQLPAQVATLLGPDHVYGFINQQAQRLLGADIAPGIAAAALPSLVETGYLRLVDLVYRTGEPFELLEMPTQLPAEDGTPDKTLYVDGLLRPLTDDEGQTQGVLVFGVDVTERVQAKQRAAELMEEVREQDRQFQQVMEGLPQMVWVSKPDGAVTYYNQRWYDFTGSSFDKMQGWGWIELLHPDDLLVTAERWQTALKQGSVFEAEHRWRDRHGTYRWFLARSEPIRAANGTILRWVGTNTDIDEQKRFQQQLAAKDEQLHRILSQSPALIATLEGPDHRYAFTNPGYDQLVGNRARLGQPVAECLPELVEQGFIELLEEVYRTGTTVARREVYVELVDPASQQKNPAYLDVTYQPLRDAGGQIHGVLAFVVDVTTQVQARQHTAALAAEVQATSLQLVQQRETFFQLFQQTPASIAILRGPDYRFDYLNPRYQALFPDRELVGQPIAEALPEIVEQGFVELIDRVYRTGETFFGDELPFQINHAGSASSTYLYFNFTYQAFRENGEVVGVTIFAYDVTEQVKTRRQTQVLQAKISRRDRELRMMAESLPQITFVTENDGRLSYVSPQWYTYTGNRPSTDSLLDWVATVHPNDLETLQTEIAAAASELRPWRCEFRLRRHDGRYRWHLSQGVPDTDPATGRPRRWFGSNTDIHELRSLQEQLLLKDQQLQQILSQVPAYIATVTGPEHRFAFTNASYNALMNGRVQLGRPAGELMPELVEQGFISLLNEVYQTNKPYVGHETHIQLLDPATGRMQSHYLDFVYQPLYDSKGQTQGILGFGVDVTEQVKARQQTEALQAELRGRDEQFRFLAESIPQIVWTSDADGQVDYFNQRLFEATGRHPHESLGESAWLHIIHPDDQARTHQVWQEATRTGDKYEIEYRFVSPTGRYRWFLGRAEPLRNTAGDIIKWFGSCTDIDDFKQAQQRLQNQNTQLLRINQDLDTFVYTASHDLRQPIYNMAGIFEELTRTTHFDDPDAAALIAMFEDALQRIYATIQDLADIVQVQRRHEQVPAEPVEVLPLVQAVIRSVQEQVDEVGAEFDLDTKAAPVLFFVRSNLQSVLYNLLSNALKYTMPGRRPRIRVRTDLVDSMLVLSVADNGLGIDLERHGAELFQMFRRFHDHVPGSGIGLHLVNRIVQQAGGRLEVESRVGEGTTFRIYFPFPAS